MKHHYYFILSLILVVNSIYALKVENIYRPINNEFYPFHPTYPNANACRMNYIYRINHSVLGMEYKVDYTIDGSISTYQSQSSVSKINSTETLLYILFYTNSGDGEFQLNITSNGEKFTDTIKTFCNENTSPSKFIVNNKTSLIYDRVDNTYKAIVSIGGSSYGFINGLCYTVYLEIQEYIPCSFRLIGDSLYYLTIDTVLIEQVMMSDYIQVNITIGDSNIDTENPDYHFKLERPINGGVSKTSINGFGFPAPLDQTLYQIGLNTYPMISLCAISNLFPQNPFISLSPINIYISPSYRGYGSDCFSVIYYPIDSQESYNLLSNNVQTEKVSKFSSSYYIEEFENNFSNDELKISSQILKQTKSIDIQIVTISTQFINYINQPILISLSDFNKVRHYPYGILNNNINNPSTFSFEYSVVLNYYSYLSTPSTSSILYTRFTNNKITTFSYGSPTLSYLSNPIIVSNLFVNHIANDIYSIKFNFNCTRGLASFSIIGLPSVYELSYDLKYLSNGDFRNGTMDLYFNYFGNQFSTATLLLKSIANEEYSIDFYIPNIYNTQINLYTSLRNLYIQYKEVTLTNQSISNIAYFTIDGTDPNQPVAFCTKNAFENITNWATFNHSLNRWQVVFEMSANILPGVFQYTIALSSDNYIKNIFLPKENQIIVNSDNYDLFGPYIMNLKKYPQASNDGQLVTEFGFEFDIIENFNQFKDGYIKVVSDDGVSFIQKLKVKDSNNGFISGNGVEGKYRVSIGNDVSICIPRVWTITEVVLKDSQGINSTFYRVPINGFFKATDPLMYYANSPDSITISITCSSNIQPTGEAFPTLSSLKFIDKDTNLELIGIDSGLAKNYSIVVECYINSGLSNDTNVVYLVDQSNNVIESKVSSRVINQNIVTYIHDIEFDQIGFGYPLGFTIGYYGLLGKLKITNGYSARQLSTMNQPFYIESDLSLTNSFIMESTKLTMIGGSVHLFGRKFTLASKVYLIIDGTKSTSQFTIHSDSIIKITVPPLKTDSDVKVYIQQQGADSTGITSNLFIIKVGYSNLNQYKTIDGGQPLGPPLPPLTPPPASEDSSELIPTNPPQKCLGSPVCGGPTQGSCSPNGCKCNPPFIGLSCESRVPDIPKPDTNENDPNSSLVIDDKNKALFEALVSLYSIREINIYGDAISTYYFGNWTKKTSESSPNIYYYNTTIENGAIINVTLEWFEQNQNVSFAGQEFEMYKSTLKYSIGISNYSFIQSLSSLQLIMSATVQSSESSNICSSKSFGNTTIDNSNFIKLNLQEKSLYARFIKRGIIDDNRVIPVSNVLLDSSLNPIESSSKTQSLVGINIPGFTKNALIDPDFSIIISSSKVNSNDNNSICSKSKLKGSQIAGIVVGSVVGVSIIIGTSFAIYRKKKLSKEMKNIKLKMQQINS